MMPRDLTDEPDVAAGESEVISGQQGLVTPPYVQLYRQITPLATIGLEQRARLATRLAELLKPEWPHQRSMAVGVVYTVAHATPDAHGQRVRSFLRWSAAYDATGDDARLAEARARRSLRAVIAASQEQLASHYALASAEQADTLGALDMLDALGGELSGRPAVELRYVSWPPTAKWLSPTHIQPVLDGLLGQEGSAALSIRIERLADEQSSDDPRLRLSIMAMGEATSGDALRTLANEFRGCGVLAPYAAKPRHMPIVEGVRTAGAQAWASIAHGHAQPWAPSHEQDVDVALTNHEAGLLLPLPMPLYEQ